MGRFGLRTLWENPGPKCPMRPTFEKLERELKIDKIKKSTPFSHKNAASKKLFLVCGCHAVNPKALNISSLDKEAQSLSSGSPGKGRNPSLANLVRTPDLFRHAPQIIYSPI